MRRFDDNKLVRELASEYGLSVDEIREIIKSPFNLFIQDIKEDRPIERRIPFLGAFKAKAKSWDYEKK